MHKSGENIGFAVTLDHALPSGMELYAVISDRSRLRSKVFSTESNTISVLNSGWTQFAFQIPAAVSVSMMGDWHLELKLKSTGSTAFITISPDVTLHIVPSAAGAAGVEPSETLPVYTNGYDRIASGSEPTSANVVISSGILGVGTAESTQQATVNFRQWLKGEKGNVNYATFTLDPDTGVLTEHITDDYSGPSFRISDNGEMIVTF